MNNYIKIIEKFDDPDAIIKCEPYGKGHINDTFLVEYQKNSKLYKYILRKINRSVFSSPLLIVENTIRITEHIRQKKQLDENKYHEDQLLRVRKTRSGINHYKDSNDDIWCMLNFIENSYSLELVENEDQAFNAAKAYGGFLRDLWDFDINNCHETIKDFHNLSKRIIDYYKAIDKDPLNRVRNIKYELETIKEFNFISAEFDELAKIDLPLRITHNDTKINNVLFDSITGKSICIIDLDTVMPGPVINDFGDMVRTFTPSINEDQKDAAKCGFRLEIFESLVKGYFSEVGDLLSTNELNNMVKGALFITYEQSIRFLTDYISGDIYYKTNYEGQNLERAKNQILLLNDLISRRKELEEIFYENFKKL